MTVSEPRNYNVITKTQIISIGNSQGVRIPKILLEQSKLSGEVELELKDEGNFDSSGEKTARGMG